MGRMIEGRWTTDEEAATRPDGEWQRAPSVLRGSVDRGEVAPGRFHLYAAWNCPWAHRALLVRAVLGLGDALPVSFVAPRRTDQGWVFDPGAGFADGLGQASALHEVYSRGLPGYTGRATVPLLVEAASGRLVSNDSAGIARMLATDFLPLARRPRDLCPPALLPEIDAWNARIHDGLNNGVYRAGFAESQAAYDRAVTQVFATLDAIEARLASADWLVGDTLTEADLRLFPTLARFDVAYHLAFKCTRRRLVDYPALWRYARRLYALPGVAGTVKFDIYRRGYFSPSPKRNPLGIVPVAPDIDWSL